MVALLRDAFERRLLAQLRQIALADALGSDAALLDALARGEPVAVEVRGAGFFEPDAAPRTPALCDLAARIASHHGETWLERRAAEVVASPHALRPEALASDEELALDPVSTARLLALREGLLALTTRLAASARPDWGEAFLLAAARIAAIDASLASGRLVVLDAPELRVTVGALLPAASRRVAVAPLSNRTPEAIARALAATRAAEAALQARLEERYGYDLVRRSCVTEILRTITLALGEDAAREHSERRLGGHVDPAAGGNFVPFVSSRSVRARWNVVDHARLESALEHAARDGSLASALRERNTFTSSFHEPADRAGFFVFFADAPWPLRPLLGAFDLATALVRGGVGLATLPLDRGEGLRRGLDGALWSVPELVFANVRKGTSDCVAPALRPPAE